MPETYPLLRAILEHPREWDRLAVYADWLDEVGSPEALGWRLMASERQWPATSGEPRAWLFWWARCRNLEIRHPESKRARHCLPSQVHRILELRDSRTRFDGDWYAGTEASLRDAACAFADAWLDGWRPDRPRFSGG